MDHLGLTLPPFKGFLAKTKGLLLGQDAKDAQELAKIAGFAAAAGKKAYLGAIGLKKWLKGRKPEKATELKDGRLKIKFKAEAEFTTKEVMALLANEKAMRAIDRITAPLEKEGIEVLNIRDPETDKLVDLVRKSDRKYLQAPISAHHPSLDLTSPEMATTDGRMVSKRTTLLRLTKVSFKRGNKYTVVEGDTEFNVAIEDEAFLESVERDEVKFSANGKMRVILRQEIIPGDIKDTVEHAVEVVIEYIEPPPPPAQAKLLTD